MIGLGKRRPLQKAQKKKLTATKLAPKTISKIGNRSRTNIVLNLSFFSTVPFSKKKTMET